MHSLRRRLDDVSNEDGSNQRRQKRARQSSPEGGRTELEEDGKDSSVDEDLAQEVNDLRHAGRRFVLTKQLWPSYPRSLYKTAAEENYEPKDHFKTSKTKLQGDVHDLLEVVPARFHAQLNKKSISHEVETILS